MGLGVQGVGTLVRKVSTASHVGSGPEGLAPSSVGGLRGWHPALALSGYARSNGVLNAGYICFQTIHRAYDALAVQVLIAGALRSICVYVPFIAFQANGYYNICLGHSVEETKPWCKARIPLLYNFIQSHNWYVGLTNYHAHLRSSREVANEGQLVTVAGGWRPVSGD
ncbi:hypothetical protein LguiA_007686 [Lonicera macranthoides]